MAQTLQNPLAIQEIRVQSLDQEDPLGKEVATHSSIFRLGNPMDRAAWRATVHWVTRVRHNVVTKPPTTTTHLSSDVHTDKTT